ncbi:L,D-transpeptidase [uncultured Bacteroides sp.]|uniref:L,D-transpeptidase n=1 Tax=uncultured Bacteroides sp. TaxID=162156 RepID=UPI00261B42BD|nr:L,D-transpeptidase [uncultured Bacteroides sp.]
MKHSVLFVCIVVCLIFAGCNRRQESAKPVVLTVNKAEYENDTVAPEFLHLEQTLLRSEQSLLTADDVTLIKELFYDQHTLEDTYPYKDTVRSFKWDEIRESLAYIENMQADTARWVVLQNYKNQNKEAPLVRKFVRNAYRRVSDTLGVERYQSVPLYLPTDTLVPERYGRDGTVARLRGEEGSFCRIHPVTFDEEWLVPRRYLKRLADSTAFDHVVFVDRLNQNIATLEHVGKGEWKIRSMNPATTGRHSPPYAQETPLGMYLIQQKKTRMVFLKDGSAETGGYAPYASRFTNGAYIHGVPVNVPRTSMIEYSWSLGTTPRSHMCVRNATSHAKFVFDWAPTERSLVVVIE